MPWKIGQSRPAKPSLNPETLAVCIALALVAGLFAAMIGGSSRGPGPDGCTAQTWRNPVTGRPEAVGRARLDADGRLVCR